MTIIRIVSILAPVLVALMACSRQQASLPVWLEGSWATGDTLGLVTESWEVINNTFMTGEGLLVNKEKKSVTEMLNIFIKDGMLVYTALLPDQNNGEEIIFINSSFDPDSLVFENPSHDYPKKIIYHHRESEKIDVYLHGSRHEKVKHIPLKKTAE